MTGHKSKGKQKNMFQNMKVDDKIQKWTKKLNYEDRGMAEDMLEVVGDIKQTVTVLETITKQLKAMLYLSISKE